MADHGDQTPDLLRRLRRSQRLNVVFGAMALFLLVVVATQQAGSPGGVRPSASASANPTSTAMQAARGQVDDPMAWGDLEAPVVVVQWTDFRCPFCASFATGTLPTLFSKYVETGKVRFELHDVAFFGDQSVDAAVGARAAAAQGKAREFMNALFAAAPASGHPDLTKAKLISFARQANVPDLARFTAALDDQGLRQNVIDSTTKAQKMGVTSVPFFIIGNQVVSGAQPLEKFTAAIEAELAAK